MHTFAYKITFLIVTATSNSTKLCIHTASCCCRKPYEEIYEERVFSMLNKQVLRLTNKKTLIPRHKIILSIETDDN